MSNSLWPHGLYSPWNSPGKNTGVCSLSLLQEIFPTQGSKTQFSHIAGGVFTSCATTEAYIVCHSLITALLLKHIKTHFLASVTVFPRNDIRTLWCLGHSLPRLITLGVSVRVCLDEISIWANKLRRADCPPPCGQAYPTLIRTAWIEPKGWEENTLSLCDILWAGGRSPQPPGSNA